MALAQLQLFSTRRDRFGIAADYRTVFRAFGLTPDAAHKAGVTAGNLLRLYRDRVDGDFHWKGHSKRDALCRKVDGFGFPAEVYALVHRALTAADTFTGPWVHLINGKRTTRRNDSATTFTDRLHAADAAMPAVPAPQSAKTIATYVNHLLDPQTFSHGKTGVMARIPAAIAEVEGLRGTPAFDTEPKVDAALRTLYWMREHPVPLYVSCDFSPRLKADHYNQAMNLQSQVRRALYTDRDVELDLDKAHMAALVRIARDRGVEMPVTERALRASLAGVGPDGAPFDLWADLADRFDADVLTDAGARRKTAKTAYAVVYGSEENNTLFSMAERYAELTGDFHDFDPFRGVLDHPMMAEVLSVRDRLLALVEAEGGMADVEGRWIPTGSFDHKKRPERAVLSYVAASYEQALVAEAFKEASAEVEWAAAVPGRRPRFKVWLYQADGFTLRLASKQVPGPVVRRLQDAVARKAAELGLVTALTVQYGEV